MILRLENGEVFDSETRPIWITRDSRDGVLVEDVDVWRSRPIRFGDAEGDSIVWVPSDARGEMASFRTFEVAHVANVPIEIARQAFATLPETDRECVWLAGDMQTRPENLL